MSENNNSRNPVFRFDISGVAVTVRFSDTETADVKDRIRDILTESYEERFQRSIQGRKHYSFRYSTLATE